MFLSPDLICGIGRIAISDRSALASTLNNISRLSQACLANKLASWYFGQDSNYAECAPLQFIHCAGFFFLRFGHCLWSSSKEAYYPQRVFFRRCAEKWPYPWQLKQRRTWLLLQKGEHLYAPPS